MIAGNPIELILIDAHDGTRSPLWRVHIAPELERKGFVQILKRKCQRLFFLNKSAMIFFNKAPDVLPMIFRNRNIPIAVQNVC